MNAKTAYVTYFRVSTDRQGRSGLGLEAQEAAVQAFVGQGKIVARFVEIESGRNCDRPQLAAAIERCRQTGATLLVAKLDRLARSVLFIAKLMESGVPFVAADLPNADRFTLHILSAVAEQEARAISARTKSALAAARARGTKLGGYRGRAITPDEARRGNEVRARLADQHAASLAPLLAELHEAGALTLAAKAQGLNARGVLTPRGGAWRPVQVARALARSGAIA